MPGLIGREIELDHLTRALDASGALILVSGDAGVGKTRLVREAVKELEVSRQVVWGRPEQVTTPGPYALIIDALQNIIDTSPTKEVQTEVTSMLEGLSSTPGPAGLPLRRVAAEVRGILSMLGERPIVIFEDLHISDEASNAILLHLARSAPEDRFFLIATFRTEEVVPGERLGRFLETITRERLAKEMHLEPLSLESSVRLAERILSDSAREFTARRIAELSEGNPFFVEELASSFSPLSKALPPSISRIVSTRRAALGVMAEQIAKAACLMWGSIDVDVLAIACELERTTVIRGMTELIRAGILEDRDQRVVFRHALIREGILEDLTSLEVEDLNRRIASGIEEFYRDTDLSGHAMALSQHWYWARDRTRAMGWALRAGKRALDYAATSEAQAAFELAIACSTAEPPPQALVGLAEVEIRDGRAGNAEEMLSRAAQGFERTGDLEGAAAALGRVAWIRTVTKSGDPLKAIDQALVIARLSSSERQQARLLAQKGQIHVHTLGSLDEGRRLLESALESASLQNDLVVQSECLDTLAWEAEFGRRSSEADSRAEEASRLALESGAAETIGRTLNNRALLLTLHGDPHEAIGLLDTAREKLRGSFGASGLAVIDLTEAIARWRMGEPSLVAQLVSVRESVWAHWRGYTRILDAWSAMHVGDDARANRTVALGWQELSVQRDAESFAGDELSSELFEAAVCELLVSLEIGKKQSADLANALLKLGRTKTADDHLLSGWLGSRSMLSRGDVAGAKEIVGELFEEMTAYESPYFRGLALEVRALIQMSSSNTTPVGAVADLEQAIDVLQACSNEVDQARCLRVLSSCLSAADPAKAVELANSSRTIAIQSGSSLETGRSEALLRSLGVRPRGGRPRKSAEDSRSLSRRENEVAALVALGHTNAEIGAKLYLSDRTVQDHITHALRKIGSNGRAGLAAWAAKNGLV